MKRITVEREQLHQAVDNLPDTVLVELASFLDYLQYKSTSQAVERPTSSGFLAAIAGLGCSGQSDIAERDEEILQNEVDPMLRSLSG
ncbi:MAG: hypothetical protein F6J87_03605 [Spirulina sp. SIO3F2]|nr:hypothetical protein [Spirulina sp. SIO3F2]